MKKTLFILKTCLLAIFLSACTDDESIDSNSSKMISDISIDKQYAFIDDEINLTFQSIEYDEISVTSTEADIIITSSSETSYAISANSEVSATIDITSTIDTISEVNQVFVNFLEHGVDYKIVEGISMDIDNIYKMKLIHGEPEGQSTTTITNINATTGDTTYVDYDYNYYFSKGLSFMSLPTNNIVISTILYGDNWSIESSDGTINDGDIFPYDIDGLGTFTSTEGILMQDVVTKYGDPNDISIVGSAVTYKYNDLNSSITGNQFGYFTFNSEDENDYTDKKVTAIRVD